MRQPDKEHPIVAVSSRIAYQNLWITIREDKTLRAGDKKGIYGVVKTPDSVITAAINDKNEIYVIYGYSYPTDTWSWQIPGGGGDGEEPKIAARRELFEETGIVAERFELLGKLIVCCGLLGERMDVVVATNLKQENRPNDTDDRDSITEGKFVSLAEVERMVNSGEICDSQTTSALYLVEKWIKKHDNRPKN